MRRLAGITRSAAFAFAGRLALWGALSACSSGPPLTWNETQSQVGDGVSFCDAYAVIQDKCVRCHAEPPRNGAPFSLATYADTQQPAPSSREPERIRADRMLDAVESGSMPLTSFLLDPPVEALTCEEKATLVAWLKDGAKGPPDGDERCDAAMPALLGCGEGGAAGSGQR